MTGKDPKDMTASELLTSFTTEDLKKLGCKSLDD